MKSWTRMIAATAIAGGAVASSAADAQVMALNPTTMIGYAGVAAAGQHAQRQIGSRIAQRRPAPSAIARRRRWDGRAFVPIRRSATRFTRAPSRWSADRASRMPASCASC